MNGISSGASNATTGINYSLEELKQAISAIYDPRSDNDTRKSATIFLDEAKSLPNATTTGYRLALDASESPMIRHYGLSLLEYTIRYRWDDLERDEADSCRNMVIDLAQKMDDNTIAFLRNKTAQLWVDIAKKVWPDSWQDLDAQMLQLWQASFSHQMMALQMLEMLSDDAFATATEAYSDGAKGGSLGKACSEIFIPAKTYSEIFPGRSQIADVRAGEEGWIYRLLERLTWCCQNIGPSQEPRSCAIQALNVLRSAMSWIPLKVVEVTGCVGNLATCLQAPDTQMQTVSVRCSSMLRLSNTARLPWTLFSCF